MREPRPDAVYATPDDIPGSYLLPEFIEAVKQGRVVYLTEHDEQVGALVPLDVARAGLAASGRTANQGYRLKVMRRRRR